MQECWFSSIIPVYMVYISCTCSQVVLYNVLKSRCWGSVGNMLPHPLPEHPEPSGINVLVLSHVTVSCVHWEQTYCGNDINTAERLTKYYQRQTLLQNPQRFTQTSNETIHIFDKFAHWESTQYILNNSFYFIERKNLTPLFCNPCSNFSLNKTISASASYGLQHFCTVLLKKPKLFHLNISLQVCFLPNNLIPSTIFAEQDAVQSKAKKQF